MRDGFERLLNVGELDSELPGIFVVSSAEIGAQLKAVFASTHLSQLLPIEAEGETRMAQRGLTTGRPVTRTGGLGLRKMMSIIRQMVHSRHLAVPSLSSSGRAWLSRITSSGCSRLMTVLSCRRSTARSVWILSRLSANGGRSPSRGNRFSLTTWSTENQVK